MDGTPLPLIVAVNIKKNNWFRRTMNLVSISGSQVRNDTRRRARKRMRHIWTFGAILASLQKGFPSSAPTGNVLEHVVFRLSYKLDEIDLEATTAEFLEGMAVRVFLLFEAVKP